MKDTFLLFLFLKLKNKKFEIKKNIPIKFNFYKNNNLKFIETRFRIKNYFSSVYYHLNTRTETNAKVLRYFAEFTKDLIK